MAIENRIIFIDRADFSARPGYYTNIDVESSLVLKSWKLSLFSFEWLRPDGSIKPLEELAEAEAEKRRLVEIRLRNGEPFEKPILGIGVMDNVEIGVGRAEFLTLAAHGVRIIPVHIPTACESDFKACRPRV